MSQGKYVLDTAAEGEGERLETLQQYCDETTFRHLRNLGVGPGWTCLEVAAGKGSVAEWLCEQVGDTGRVVATDLATLYLDKIDAPNLEVRRHDIVQEDLETGVFDLIHARFLLEHIPQREQVLAKLVAALAPGGWLLIEDADFNGLGSVYGASRVFCSLTFLAGLAALRRQGHDRHWGGRLPGLYHAHGLTEIGGDARSLLLIGGPATADWIRPTLTRVRGFLRNGKFDETAAPGPLAAAISRWPAALAWADRRLDRMQAVAGDPNFTCVGPPIVSAWGRKPA